MSNFIVVSERATIAYGPFASERAASDFIAARPPRDLAILPLREVPGSTTSKVRGLTDTELYAYREATVIADDVAFILARAPELASEVPEVPTRADVARLAQRFRERTPNTLTDERLFWSEHRKMAARLTKGLPEVDVALLRRGSTWPPHPERATDMLQAEQKRHREQHAL